MKRIFGQLVAVVATAAGAVVLTPACTENNESIFIRNVVAPPQQRTNGSCVYSPDPAGVGLFGGVVDALFTDEYGAVLLVGSQLAPRGETINARAESNRSILNGAVVRVTETNGALIHEFTAPGTGNMDVASGNTPAYGVFSAAVIDAETLRRVVQGWAFGQKKNVLVNIKVFGKTLGGVDLESGEFQFPVTICVGCLVKYVDADPAAAGINCPFAAGDNTTSVPVPCRFGEDEEFSCQICSEDFCRTPPPTDWRFTKQ